MKTLILFSTRDGQTREIASYLASELKELGIYSDVVNLNRTEQIARQDYDRVVIGASIRYGHFHPALDRFVKSIRRNSLSCGAFYSVNPLPVKQRSVRRRLTAIRVSFAEFAMAARYLFCLCWRAALPALPLVRPLYDPPDHENDGRGNGYA